MAKSRLNSLQTSAISLKGKDFYNIMLFEIIVTALASTVIYLV